MSFENLGLSDDLLRAIKEQGYETPTPIQQQSIPIVLAQRDMMGSAQTGTGKTASFVLPLLQRLTSTQPPYPQAKRASRPTATRSIRALILTPTRELAAQVGESVATYGKYLPLTSAVIFGGVNMGQQVRKVRAGIDILIATPGRLLDHIAQRTLQLSEVKLLVLDEADRMLDMGFIKDVKKIIELLPKKRQTLLFSATFSQEIKKLAGELLKEPQVVEISRSGTTAKLIKQVVHPVDKNRKRELLSYLIGSKNWKQVLVFTRTKHGADRLAKQLNQDGLRSIAIHGNKTQGARTKALDQFKQGKARVLVATDIAARGLDIDQLPHVVNFELPQVPEDYVHRIGRTGRAGQEGEALSLVCVDELILLRNIQRLLKTEIPQMMTPGYEPDPSIRAEPIQRGRARSRNHAREYFRKRKMRRAS